MINIDNMSDGYGEVGGLRGQLNLNPVELGLGNLTSGLSEGQSDDANGDIFPKTVMAVTREVDCNISLG